MKIYYRLNPLFVEYPKYYFFQIYPLKAIGLIKNLATERIVNFLNCKEFSSTDISSILKTNEDKYNPSLTELIKNNVIIEKKEFRRKLLHIVDQYIKIVLEQKNIKKVTKISQIYRYNIALGGHQILRVLSTAIQENFVFKLMICDQKTMILEVFNGLKKVSFNSNSTRDFFSQDARAIKLTRSKSLTNYILSHYLIPVPKQQFFNNDDFNKVFDFIKIIGYPVCIKDEYGCEGNDVFPDLRSDSEVCNIIKYLSNKKNPM